MCVRTHALIVSLEHACGHCHVSPARMRCGLWPLRLKPRNRKDKSVLLVDGSGALLFIDLLLIRVEVRKRGWRSQVYCQAPLRC